MTPTPRSRPGRLRATEQPPHRLASGFTGAPAHLARGAARRHGDAPPTHPDHRLDRTGRLLPNTASDASTPLPPVFTHGMALRPWPLTRREPASRPTREEAMDITFTTTPLLLRARSGRLDEEPPETGFQRIRRRPDRWASYRQFWKKQVPRWLTTARSTAVARCRTGRRASSRRSFAVVRRLHGIGTVVPRCLLGRAEGEFFRHGCRRLIGPRHTERRLAPLRTRAVLDGDEW
jgi:hypothetical protein